MGSLIQDVKYALRMLRKAPGFTAVVIATLTLGIGANTAIFSVVDAVLLRPLPFPRPEQLVSVKDDLQGQNLTDMGMSVPELVDFQERSGVFDQISAVWPNDANVTGGEKPERLEMQGVSPNYFTLLGAHAELGRLFGPQDYRPGFFEGAVISDSLWRRMFGADPNVLQKSLRLDSDLYQIIGVLPPGFRHPGPTLEHDVDVWATAGFVANPFPAPPLRSVRILPGAIARLKPGLTLKQAQAQLNSFATHLREEYPADYPASARWVPRLVPLKQEVVGKAGTLLLILLASVGLVLLIACVNIASLLLARSSLRQHEIAIRRALGARSGRLIRQTLTESAVLGLCGGLLALLFSGWLTRLLLSLVPSNLPRVGEVTTSGSVLLFTVGMSLLVGLLFGLAPAIQLSHPRLMESLRQGTRGGEIGLRQHRFLGTLIVAEFALSLILVVGAGLTLRSFWNLLQVQPGFNASRVVVAHLWLPVPNDPQSDPYRPPDKRNAFIREVIRRVNGLPGVRQAAIGSLSMPFSSQKIRSQFAIEGRLAGGGETPSAELCGVAGDLFSVLEVPLIRGRLFTDADNEKGDKVVLIDQTSAERFWPNEEPIGKKIQLLPAATPNPAWLSVVGIVGRMKSDGLDAPFAPHLFVPSLQFRIYAMNVYIRTESSPEDLEEPIRREDQDVDPNLPVFGVKTLEGVVSNSLAPRRFAMEVLGFFALTALLLSAIGIYGVMAYFVSRRAREIGIRIAIGAQPRDIFRLILGRGLALTALGIGLGLIGALGLLRLLNSIVYGVSSIDPITFFGGAILLSLVALAACYIPARRAMRVDPVMTLRDE